jgi:hypothetical protein
VNFGVLGFAMHVSCIRQFNEVHGECCIMFKVFMTKLAVGVALLVGFVACGAGSEETTEDLAAPSVGDVPEASGGEVAAASPKATGDGEKSSATGADTSAAVEPSALVCVDCYGSLATCFTDRDAIFEQAGVVCVCQPPDLDQCCTSSLVDLECNL